MFISTHGTLQHRAPVRLSYTALQGRTGPNKSTTQQSSSVVQQEEDLLMLSTAVHKVEICPLYHRITKLNRPDERSTERCKGPASCHPAFPRVFTPLIDRNNFYWDPFSTTHPQTAHSPFFFWTWKGRRECRSKLLKTVKGQQLQDKPSSLGGACDIQSQFPVLLALC